MRAVLGVLGGAGLAAIAAGLLLLPGWLGHGGGSTGAVYPLTPSEGGRNTVPLTYADTGPPLLFVDRERVTGPGLLARAEISGAVRLFGYEEPAPGVRLTFAWVLRNGGPLPVAVTVSDQAATTPGLRYLPIAAAVQRAFLQGSAHVAFTVAPGQIRVLRDAAAVPATGGELAFSLYDLRLDGSLQVLDVATSALTGLGPADLPAAPAGGGGTDALLPHDTRLVSATLPGTPSALRLAAHDAQDPALAGRGTLGGMPSSDKGNYGVTYRVRLTFPPSGRRDADLWVTAGGCDLRADFLMRSGPLAGRVLQVPAVGSLPSGRLGTALAEVALHAGAPTVLSFSLLPPAASCTPIEVREEPVDPDSPAVRLYQVSAWRWLTGLWDGR